MKYNVIIYPGSNCDYDSYYVVKKIMKAQVDFVWHKESKLKNPDCVIIPGGFSYGDYLRPGAIAKFSPIMKDLHRFVDRGGLVIGICNGFQVLTETDLLPGTLLQNTSLNFICKHQYVTVKNSSTPFTEHCNDNMILDIPIAHNEGNYYVDDSTLRSLRKNNQIIFQYCDKNGKVSEQSNPNGSVLNIAGITNKSKNVLGMMPHPERVCDPNISGIDGQKIFKSIHGFFGTN